MDTADTGKKTVGRLIRKIVLWALVVLAAMIALGYYLPAVAHWGYAGTVRVMEARLNRLEIPAARVADLRQYVAALSRYIETTHLDVPHISRYIKASDPLEKVLRKGQAQDSDMWVIQQAFREAQISVEAEAASPTAKAKISKRTRE